MLLHTKSVPPWNICVFRHFSKMSLNEVFQVARRFLSRFQIIVNQQEEKGSVLSTVEHSELHFTYSLFLLSVVTVDTAKNTKNGDVSGTFNENFSLRDTKAKEKFVLKEAPILSIHFISYD